VATRVIPKTELRERIRQELADLGEDSLLITDRGRPLAVVVSVGRWNMLQETIEDLEDRVAVLEERSVGGDGRPAEAVFAEIEAEEADVQGSARHTG
jgi:prevent-host-death family protein